MERGRREGAREEEMRDTCAAGAEDGRPGMRGIWTHQMK